MILEIMALVLLAAVLLTRYGTLAHIIRLNQRSGRARKQVQSTHNPIQGFDSGARGRRNRGKAGVSKHPDVGVPNGGIAGKAE